MHIDTKKEGGRAVANYEALKAKAQVLAEKKWDLPAIESRYRRLVSEGISGKSLDRTDILSRKQEILDRVQRRGEEYELLSHS